MPPAQSREQLQVQVVLQWVAFRGYLFGTQEPDALDGVSAEHRHDHSHAVHWRDMVMVTARDSRVQQTTCVATADLPQGSGHPFYERLSHVLNALGFDALLEKSYAPFYARMGRRSLPPRRYFRLLFVRLLEGLDSERPIARRAAASLSLRSSPRTTPPSAPPDRPTIARTPRPLSLETHQVVSTCVLQQRADVSPLRGKTGDVPENRWSRRLMRRDDLRRHPLILKSPIVHFADCNLGLLLPHVITLGTPRSHQGRPAAAFCALLSCSGDLCPYRNPSQHSRRRLPPTPRRTARRHFSVAFSPPQSVTDPHNPAPALADLRGSTC